MNTDPLLTEAILDPKS